MADYDLRLAGMGRGGTPTAISCYLGWDRCMAMADWYLRFQCSIEQSLTPNPHHPEVDELAAGGALLARVVIWRRTGTSPAATRTDEVLA